MQGGPVGEKIFRKKSLAMPKKNERVEPLVSPGMVCYAEKQENPFWFSSLDQIVQFGAIIFCRTFVELFWSVHVDRKKSHYNSRVSLHEAPTKKQTSASIQQFSELSIAKIQLVISHGKRRKTFTMKSKSSYF